jgi:hypothetical protein
VNLPTDLRAQASSRSSAVSSSRCKARRMSLPRMATCPPAPLAPPWKQKCISPGHRSPTLSTRASSLDTGTGERGQMALRWLGRLSMDKTGEARLIFEDWMPLVHNILYMCTSSEASLPGVASRLPVVPRAVATPARTSSSSSPWPPLEAARLAAAWGMRLRPLLQWFRQGR